VAGASALADKLMAANAARAVGWVRNAALILNIPNNSADPLNAVS
jgi:molybdopterin biosynthesis enzyme MoaB